MLPRRQGELQGHGAGAAVLKAPYLLAVSVLKAPYLLAVSVQNCKQLFMYMNNWDKGVGPAICP